MRNFCLFVAPLMAVIVVLLCVLFSHLHTLAAKHSNQGPYSLTRLPAAELLDLLE